MSIHRAGGGCEIYFCSSDWQHLVMCTFNNCPITGKHCAGYWTNVSPTEVITYRLRYSAVHLRFSCHDNSHPYCCVPYTSAATASHCTSTLCACIAVDRVYGHSSIMYGRTALTCLCSGGHTTVRQTFQDVHLEYNLEVQLC